MNSMFSYGQWLMVVAVLGNALGTGRARADDATLAGQAVVQTEQTEAQTGAMKPSRSFTFDYGAELLELTPGATARVWFPIAASNPQQEVALEGVNLPAGVKDKGSKTGKIIRGKDAKYGNEIGYFEVVVPENGRFAFGVSYQVKRKLAGAYGKGVAMTDQERSLFLSANSKVPIDGRPLELIGQNDLPKETVAKGKFLYDVVGEHMKYDKSKPGYGKGDAVWACDSRFGNCTDFHSLFISLARSQSVAAKFEIGFPLPPDEKEGSVGGYHCWAWFHSENEGWFPVDISEADKHPEMKEFYFGRLTADRVTMSVGRDIELVPRADGGRLNYFVYPHVEVDGVVVGKEKMKGRFGFKDER